MILILVAIILILIITIVHLCLDFYHQKKAFENRIDVLEDIVYGIGSNNKEVIEKKEISNVEMKLASAYSQNSVLLSTVKSRED